MAHSRSARARLGITLAAGIGLGVAAPALSQGFEGGYLGLYGATIGGSSIDAGAYGGYRFQVMDNTYLGAEADILVPSGATDYVAAGLGSLGYEVMPDTLVYGHTGLALDSAGSGFWVAGAGVDFGVTDSLNLRIGGDRYEDLGGPAGDWVAKAGVALSF